MDQNKFKKQNKPAACTLPPWADLIPKNIRYETLLKIRQETIEIYGYSMDECPKRMVCLGKTCIGRPMPFKSPTAAPYIEQLHSTHTFVKDELYVSNCDICPIKLSCSSTCAQVTDYMNRDKIQEPSLDFRESLDNLTNTPEKVSSFDTLVSRGKSVPWDALNEKRKSVVEKYLYEQKDFLTIAKELQLFNEKDAKYELYAALTTLSEYAIMRQFYEENSNKLKPLQKELLEQVYIMNNTITETAKILKYTRSHLQQVLSDIIKTNNIKWHIFVKKQGNKIVYNTLEILK